MHELATLTFYHSLAENFKKSSREFVGLQLWRGAFLLADYIISNPDIFRDKAVLELAAGTGFTSLVASKWAKKVVCTDLGQILPLIRNNYQINKDLGTPDFTVMEVDFFQSDWKSILKEQLQEIDIILVADVIYNKDITKAFFNTLEFFIENSNEHLQILVTMEKRWWTNEEGEREAPSYDYFLKHLKDLERNLELNIQTISNNSVKHHLSQYYSRNEDLIFLQINKPKIT